MPRAACSRANWVSLSPDELLWIIRPTIYVSGEAGTAKLPSDEAKGGLAPWQRRWLLEILADSKGQSELGMLARGCGLSTGHFARCFKKSFGMPVHRYIVKQRIEVAKALLLKPGSSLTEVAQDTGFSNQAALGRTFAAFVGAMPAKWCKEKMYTKGTSNLGGKMQSTL